MMMVYEDFDMAVQAKKVCDLLAQEAGVGDEVQLSVWRFDAIASGDPSIAAGPQAEQADVIVVAARDLDRLPAQVEDWLERWPAHRHAGPGALVAVFHPDAAKDGDHVQCRSPALAGRRPGGHGFLQRHPRLDGATLQRTRNTADAAPRLCPPSGHSPQQPELLARMGD